MLIDTELLRRHDVVDFPDRVPSRYLRVVVDIRPGRDVDVHGRGAGVSLAKFVWADGLAHRGWTAVCSADPSEGDHALPVGDVEVHAVGRLIPCPWGELAAAEIVVQ